MIWFILFATAVVIIGANALSKNTQKKVFEKEEAEKAAKEKEEQEAARIKAEQEEAARLKAEQEEAEKKKAAAELEKKLRRIYTFDVEGVKEKNANGTDRQSILTKAMEKAESDRNSNKEWCDQYCPDITLGAYTKDGARRCSVLLDNKRVGDVPQEDVKTVLKIIDRSNSITPTLYTEIDEETGDPITMLELDLFYKLTPAELEKEENEAQKE